MAKICVIGAGPAGSTFATRMAQFGHEVLIIERVCFPRCHLGESLSAGVLSLLEVTEAREAVESAGLKRVGRILVKWDGELQVRDDPREEGILVDRGKFDQLLLERAKTVGVRVMQPARVRERLSGNDGWTIDVAHSAGTMQVHSDFLADAGGRSSSTWRRRRTGCETLALYAYWHGSDLPHEPRIEAGEDAWYWGVPLPGGSFNTLVFIDLKRFSGPRRQPIDTLFLELLRRSSLIGGCRNAHRVSPVIAADATPYLHEDSVNPSSIRVGEAALAIDPISSSGVQKAIQSALAAAVVANTLLCRPASNGDAMRFYTANLAAASERHCNWAASHYGRVAACKGGGFWLNRGAYRNSNRSPFPVGPVEVREITETGVALSSELKFVKVPCIDGEFVTTKWGLHHPNLDSPLVYLAGQELVPLLRQVSPGFTPMQVAQSWSTHLSVDSGLAIAGWLFQNGLLVRHLSPHGWMR